MEVISKVARTAVRHSLHRLVRWLWERCLDTLKTAWTLSSLKQVLGMRGARGQRLATVGAHKAAAMAKSLFDQGQQPEAEVEMQKRGREEDTKSERAENRAT